MSVKSLQLSLLIGFLSLMLYSQAPLFQNKETESLTRVTGKANPKNVLRAYKNWEKAFSSGNKTDQLTIRLEFNKAFSRDKILATGIARIDLGNGEIEAAIDGLDSGKSYQLSLQGTLEQKKHRVTLGQFQKTNRNRLTYKGKLDRVSLYGFHLSDLQVHEISENEQEPVVLVGAPSLFQRIYFSEKKWSIARLGHSFKQPSDNTESFSFLLPAPAYARPGNQDVTDQLTDLVAAGRELFKSETFDGNGRTCETCHRFDNNHTIDPKYIVNLPDNDPLFIAELNPELADLENPKLLRQLGLIKANIDGFDKPGVFRGVPHIFAMPTSIIPELEFEGQQVVHSLGWSADGSPGDGSLRMFTVGAVIQHMPKRMDRVENVDFRLPNTFELDALEAYMLSLGRSSDPDLDAMRFTSPVVQRGLELFHSKEPGTGQCKGCHFNGGANSSTSFQNGNRDTGVENMPENPALLVWGGTPVDGGFGLEESQDCGPSGDQTCYGNREFNMTTVIEAADTGPFFHNNSVNTIEEAVAFYNSDAFHQSPGANPADPDDPESVCERCIHLEPTQVVSVALFLRTLNAIENIRSSNDLDEQLKAMQNFSIDERVEMIKIAMAETEDAIEVLEGGVIIPYAESIRLLKQALSKQRTVLALQRIPLFSANWEKVTAIIEDSVAIKQEAKQLMLVDEV